MLLNCGVGADSWESLDCKEIQPVHPKEDQSWVFIGRTDAKAETPVLWPPHVKSWLTGKDSDAGGDWGQEKKGTTEDEMAGWHHWLDGNEFGWTPGVGDGQGGLACCGSWGRKEADTTEQLNWYYSPGLIVEWLLIALPRQTLEKAMAPHSSTLAWKIPWTEEPGGLQSMGLRRVRHYWAISLWLFTFMHWRRNGNPLQCSCLQNLRDGGAWWAAVYGVAQSWTQLKWLSSSSRGQTYLIITALHKCCDLYKLKVYGNLGAIFPTASSQFLSLCHILVVLTVLQSCSLYLLWWSVMSDITIVIVCRCHEPCLYKMVNLLSVGLAWWEVIKNLPAKAGDTGLTPGPGKFHMP